MSLYHFDGETFEPDKDAKRLSTQQDRAFALMRDSQWRTLRTIAASLGCPEQSASARVRDLRKPRFGGHKVDRRRVAGGLFEYRVVPAEELRAEEQQQASSPDLSPPPGWDAGEIAPTLFEVPQPPPAGPYDDGLQAA